MLYLAINGICAISEEFTKQHTSTAITWVFLTTNVLRTVESIKECRGKDGIYSNHLKFIAPTNFMYLKRFINSGLIHVYLPQSAMNCTSLDR